MTSPTIPHHGPDGELAPHRVHGPQREHTLMNKPVLRYRAEILQAAPEARRDEGGCPRSGEEEGDRHRVPPSAAGDRRRHGVTVQAAMRAAKEPGRTRATPVL